MGHRARSACLWEQPARQPSAPAGGAQRCGPQRAADLLEARPRTVLVQKPGVGSEECACSRPAAVSGQAAWSRAAQTWGHGLVCVLRTAEGQSRTVKRQTPRGRACGTGWGAAEAFPRHLWPCQALQARRVAGCCSRPFPDVLSLWFPERTFRHHKVRFTHALDPSGEILWDRTVAMRQARPSTS